jgi:hypothetical protein
LLPGASGKGESLRDNPLSDHDGFFYALLDKRLPDAPPTADAA